MSTVQSLEELENKFTKYEIARILGARSLQLAMDAPILLKMTKEEEDSLNFDTLKIAEKELISGVLPITVRRPLPKKSAKIIKKLSEEEIKEKLEEKAKLEKIESEKIVKENVDETPGEEGTEDVKTEKVENEDEIMEMATPEDELEEDDEVNEYE
jgi:DNA-directed RNA polymerase subunit K